MVQLVTFGVFMIVGLVLLVIEHPINKKPESERSDAENRFLAADRSAAEGMNIARNRVSPIVTALAGFGLLVFGIVWLATGQERAGWVGVVLGSMSLAFGVVLVRWRSQRGR